MSAGTQVGGWDRPGNGKKRDTLTTQYVRAGAAGPGRLVVLVLAYTGHRWGELAALRVSRVDLLRRRIHVAESVTEVDDVKAVQRVLGHARASMTLDVYADLFDDDLEAVAERLDVLARAVGGMRAPGEVAALGERRAGR